MQTHETVASFRKVAVGSNRKFGLAFTAFFCLVTFWPLVHHGPARWWALGPAVAFLGLTVFAPQWLAPLNRAWFRLGLALSTVTSPILMGLLFFGAVTPLAWYLRRKGEDPLALRIVPEAATYWTKREPPGPAAGSMTKQF